MTFGKILNLRANIIFEFRIDQFEHCLHVIYRIFFKDFGKYYFLLTTKFNQDIKTNIWHLNLKVVFSNFSNNLRAFLIYNKIQT